MDNLKCKFCNLAISHRGFLRHLFKKHSKEFKNEKDIELYSIKIRNSIDDNLIAKIISDYKENSLLILSDKYKINYGVLVNLLKCSNIELRTIKNCGICQSSKDKKKNTFIEKYGVDNPSKSESIKQKKKDTFLKNYGVDNIFKQQKFKDSLEEIFLEKYGTKRFLSEEFLSHNWQKDENKKKEVSEKMSLTRNSFDEEKRFLIYNKRKETIDNWSDEKREKIFSNKSVKQKAFWDSLTDLQREEKMKHLKNVYINNSKLEIVVKNALTLLGIDFTSQFFMGRNSFDIKLNNSNILIEVNGDWWHANPKFYKSEDLMNFPNKKVLAKELWEKDRVKILKAKDKGYRVITLWECDINSFKRDLNKLANFIKQKLGTEISEQN